MSCGMSDCHSLKFAYPDSDYKGPGIFFPRYYQHHVPSDEDDPDALGTLQAGIH